jgi:uncharacterized protein (DUF4415 family)
MSKKLGRPTAETPKQHIVSIRMDDEQLEQLREYASSHNLTITQVMLSAVNHLYKATV